MHKAMRVKDPNDVFPGHSYAVVSQWRSKKQEQTDTLCWEHTLNDARCSLSIEAEKLMARCGLYLRQTSKNRFYGSDGEQSLELSIVPVEDKRA